MKRKLRRWKMWGLITDEWQEWGFDVYHSRAEAKRLKSDNEQIKPFEVRELLRKRKE